jgi:hypothetical protein
VLNSDLRNAIHPPDSEERAEEQSSNNFPVSYTSPKR